jgi:selenocysteine lyase/cysteine desulfurase
MTQERDTTLAFDPNRRAFLGALAAGAAFAGTGLSAGSAAAQGAAQAAELRNDAAFWGEVRRLFDQKPGVRYMNIGTTGSIPVEALNVLDSENRRMARESLSGYGNFLAQRKAIAPGFGVDPDEIVISGNTSDGMCHALLGLTWERGDEIVTTNHEHPGGNVPMALLQDRFGVVIKRVTVPVGNKQTAEDYVRLFSDAIGPRHQGHGLVLADLQDRHHAADQGTRPKLAQDKGLVSICDAAHVPGMMAYNYRDLGVDFPVRRGHKWQCGPLGTGILYIRNKVTASNPRPLPAYFPARDLELPAHRRPAAAHRHRQGNGRHRRPHASPPAAATRPSTPATGQGLRDLGPDRSRQDRGLHAGHVRASQEQDREKWGVDALYSPKDDPRLACALTAFNPFRNPEHVKDKARSDQFVKRMLDENGFVIRNVNFPVPGSQGDHFGVRVSTHLWANFDDVNQLVDAMWDLSGKMNA